MGDEILLSICIPSYNRFWSVKKTLESILKCGSKEIEVVILDNCSPQNIEDEILIKDPRIHIYKQSAPVPGPNNVEESLDYGVGKYRMICLDKDMVHGEYLDEFLSCLRSNPNLTGGYCLLKSTNAGINNDFYPANDMYKHAYCGMHPSGMFFRKDIVEKDREQTKYYEKKSVFYGNPFMFDLLLARAYSSGMCMYYKNRLITIERPEDSIKIQSFSFKKENNNLFFLPDNRIDQMEINFLHLKSLNVTDEIYNKTVAAICNRTMRQATYDYKSLMRNKMECHHYRLEMKDIPNDELKKNAKKTVDRILLTSYLTLSKTKREKVARSAYFHGYVLSKAKQAIKNIINR